MKKFSSCDDFSSCAISKKQNLNVTMKIHFSMKKGKKTYSQPTKYFSQVRVCKISKNVSEIFSTCCSQFVKWYVLFNFKPIRFKLLVFPTFLCLVRVLENGLRLPFSDFHLGFWLKSYHMPNLLKKNRFCIHFASRIILYLKILGPRNSNHNQQRCPTAAFIFNALVAKGMKYRKGQNI